MAPLRASRIITTQTGSTCPTTRLRAEFCLSIPTLALGTLTLNATNLGTEILALNFVNNNHALIIEADGFATSSGSMDLQTLPSTLAGGYSFTLSGAHSDSGEMFVYGGVFSLSGTSLTSRHHGRE